MRDSDLELLFAQAGADVAPDAEFEEELLLRMEAELVAMPDDTNRREVPTSVPGGHHVVGLSGRAGGDDRSSTARWSVSVAASLLFVLGALGAVIVLSRTDVPAAPATSTATTAVSSSPQAPVSVPEPVGDPTVPTRGPDSAAAFAVVCEQWAGDLASIAELGEPLRGPLGAGADAAVGDTVDRLRSIVDDYLAAAAVGGDVLDDELEGVLAELSVDVDAELVLIARGRWDGARYTVPVIVGKLLSVNAALSDAGVDSCG